jgi:hypothetical protein
LVMFLFILVLTLINQFLLKSESDAQEQGIV